MLRIDIGTFVYLLIAARLVRIGADEVVGFRDSGAHDRCFAKSLFGQMHAPPADCDAALDAKMASSLYGRGIAKAAAGDSAGGAANIAAAKALAPKIADQFAGWGVSRK